MRASSHQSAALSGSPDPGQAYHYTRYCHASIFHHHHPSRKSPPWSPRCAEVPHDVSGDNAHRPDDDWKAEESTIRHMNATAQLRKASS
jgi:hypothetical protein